MSLLETMKDFSALLFPNSSNNNETLETWLAQLQVEISSVYKENPFCTRANHAGLIVPKIINLVRECLLSHRLSELVPLLQQISQRKPVTYWKTSLEVLYTSDSRATLVTQLVKELQNVKYLNVHEVMSEFLMFLLHSGRLDEAKQISVDKRRPVENYRDQYSEMIFRAYLGLVWYVEWSSCKARLEQQGQEDVNNANYAEIMATYAHKAMIGFKSVSEEPGVWDIFITKHVEILEFYDKLDEAECLLVTYRDKNKENINAHKYLYNYYQRNGFRKEQEIMILSDIAHCSPSDSLVLLLVEKLVADQQFSYALQYLFDLLDYPCWRYAVQPWELLHKLIDDISQSEEDKKALDNIWEMRETWWPQYHFQDVGCPCKGTQCQICTFKSNLAAILMSQGKKIS